MLTERGLGALAFTCIAHLMLAPNFAAEGAVRVANGAELARALAHASPGTTILLDPGTYQGGISQDKLQGTADQPIVITAADPQRPAVILGGTSGLHLTNPRHVEIRNLVFSGAKGNGLNIDDGGTKATPAVDVKLVALEIRDVGPRGNCDGIKLSGVESFAVQGCTLLRWGSSGSAIDMVGCHRGSVTECAFRYQGDNSANGVQTKGGSSKVTINRCRFENAGGRAVNLGGSTGLDYFRPEPQGYEAKEITVEDCTFIGSAAPIAFVGVDGAQVRYNTIYRPLRWGLRILQETRRPEFVPCRNGHFEHNLVVFRSDQVRTMVNVGPGTSPESFVFAKNLWYCLDRPADTRRLVHLPVAESGGIYDMAPRFVAADRGDLRLHDSNEIEAGARVERTSQE